MPQAPESDPRRPFILALRSTLLLGIVSTIFGLIMLIAYGYLNRLPQFRLAFKVAATLGWLLPGSAFLLASIMMKQRRRWAVVIAMLAAAGQLAIAMSLLVANYFFGPISPIPIILCVLWIAALGQLLMHLKQSLGIVASVEENQSHGFELISPRPLAAIPIYKSEAESK